MEESYKKAHREVYQKVAEQFTRKRIAMLQGHIERYKVEQGRWQKGKDWQYEYFKNQIDEAELEIRERSGLEKKT